MVSKIEKYDEEDGTSQSCVLVISNKYVYNVIHSGISFLFVANLVEIVHKIPAEKIRAVTVSKMGNEFIMHVPDKLDCRYEHPDK